MPTAGLKPGLVNIDVEDFELEVLQGATATLARWRPLIYLENDRLDRSQAPIEGLWALNCRLWWHLSQMTWCATGGFAAISEFATALTRHFGIAALGNLLGMVILFMLLATRGRQARMGERRSDAPAPPSRVFLHPRRGRLDDHGRPDAQPAHRESCRAGASAAASSVISELVAQALARKPNVHPVAPEIAP